MTWHFHVAGTEHDDSLHVDGIPVWGQRWIALDREPVEVRFPDGRKERFPVYAIATSDRAVHAAAGEVSPGVYAFFTEKPPALPVLWGRPNFRATIIRAAVVTGVVTIALFGVIGAVALWHDDGRWSAAVVMVIAAAMIADCLRALRRPAPRWPSLWRLLFRLDA